MKLPLSWLEKYVQLNCTINELVQKLTLTGLEVEDIQDNGKTLKDFIIAQVQSVEDHPNANKLHVLKVDNGKEILQIVCGAPNVYPGMKTILAPIGAVIPKYNEVLKKGVIRGVESFGMLCSENELGIGEDHTGIIDLKTDLPVGTTADKAYNTDIILDINITPNRGDCFGVKGLAQEVVAAGLATFKPEENPNLLTSSPCSHKVEIKSDLCAHFVLRTIKNVNNCKSPDWLKNNLKSMGLNPISALVDVTNYFCFLQARPLHVFDADKIKGNLVVRLAQEGEKFIGLDDKEYTLSSDMLVIADDNGVQSIAGIMGGKLSGCTYETKNVLLESAYFDPVSIAFTARKLKIDTDAKMRFERGIDPASQEIASLKACDLIVKLCGGTPSEPFTAGAEPNWKQKIKFDFNLVEKFCGFSIPKEISVSILKGLGFTVDTEDNIFVPSWRFHDVKRPIDIVEEIVRIYGLDSLPSCEIKVPEFTNTMLNPFQTKEMSVKRSLALNGLYQLITFSFMDSKKASFFGSSHIELTNPISSELNEMRPSLLPNLLDVVKRNLDRGIDIIPIFEIGPVFHSNVPNEQIQHVSGVRAGFYQDVSWFEKQRYVDVYDIKQDVLEALYALDAPVEKLKLSTQNIPSWYHPGKSGIFMLGNVPIAIFGSLHPSILKEWDIKTEVVAFEINMQKLPNSRKKIKISELNKSIFLPVERDFAFIVDQNVCVDSFLKAIYASDKEFITDVKIFDVYQGKNIEPGKKSIAFKVLFQPKDKTFTEEDIATLSQNLIQRVIKDTASVLREG